YIILAAVQCVVKLLGLTREIVIASAVCHQHGALDLRGETAKVVVFGFLGEILQVFRAEHINPMFHCPARLAALLHHLLEHGLGLSLWHGSDGAEKRLSVYILTAAKTHEIIDAAVCDAPGKPVLKSR